MGLFHLFGLNTQSLARGLIPTLGIWLRASLLISSCSTNAKQSLSSHTFKRKFFLGRVCYKNSYSTFNTDYWLLLSGGCPNPCPRKTVSNTRVKCVLCERFMDKNTAPNLSCSNCSQQFHWKCEGVTRRAYSQAGKQWNCWNCWNCCFPFNFSEAFFETSKENTLQQLLNEEVVNVNSLSADIDDSVSWFQSNIGNYYKFNLKIAYLNVNSFMSKVDEVNSRR